MAEPTGTYNPALLTDLDRARQIVADIGPDPNWLRPDAEYLAVLGQETDWRLAAARMADSLAAQYGQRVSSFSNEGLGVTWTDRVKAWQALSARLRAEVALERAAASRWTVTAPVRADQPVTNEYRRGWSA